MAAREDVLAQSCDRFFEQFAQQDVADHAVALLAGELLVRFRSSDFLHFP